MLKNVALDSAATALAFKIHKGKYYINSISCLKKITTCNQFKVLEKIF